MNHREYVAEREAREPEFKAARDALRPEYEYRRALVAARLAAGLTQKDLAARLGTTQSSVARLESGARPPRLDTLQQVAAALDVTFDITVTPDGSRLRRFYKHRAAKRPRARRDRIKAAI